MAVVPREPAEPEAEGRSAAVALLLMATGKGQAQALARYRGPDVDLLSGPSSGRAKLTIASDSRTAHALAGRAESLRLSGAVRAQCEDEVYVQVPGIDEALALYLVASHAVHPRPITEPAIAPSVRARAAGALELPAQADPGVDEVRAADLDGDGDLETIVVVTGDTDREAEHDHSVLMVLPASGPPLITGYRRKVDGADAAHVVQLEAIADVNGDGRMEIIVRHTAPWLHHHRLVVYEWKRGALLPLSENVWAESDCHPEADWPVESP